jgi:hypothetical protein
VARAIERLMVLDAFSLPGNDVARHVEFHGARQPGTAVADTLVLSHWYAELGAVVQTA